MAGKLPPEDEALLREARDAAANAYAKYSRFRVGAAVRGQLGVFRGANVENASYNLGLCAERSALSAAIGAGEREISAVAIACVDADPEGELSERMPCGACRQWIKELAPAARVIVDGKRPRSFTVDELLPHAFALKG